MSQPPYPPQTPPGSPAGEPAPQQPHSGQPAYGQQHGGFPGQGQRQPTTQFPQPSFPASGPPAPENASFGQPGPAGAAEQSPQPGGNYPSDMGFNQQPGSYPQGSYGQHQWHQPNQPWGQPPKKKSPLVWVLPLALVLLLVVGVGGFFAFKATSDDDSDGDDSGGGKKKASGTLVSPTDVPFSVRLPKEIAAQYNVDEEETEEGGEVTMTLKSPKEDKGVADKVDNIQMRMLSREFDSDNLNDMVDEIHALNKEDEESIRAHPDATDVKADKLTVGGKKAASFAVEGRDNFNGAELTVGKYNYYIPWKAPDRTVIISCLFGGKDTKTIQDTCEEIIKVIEFADPKKFKEKTQSGSDGDSSGPPLPPSGSAPAGREPSIEIPPPPAGGEPIPAPGGVPPGDGAPPEYEQPGGGSN